jgi:hypothetical protein
MNPRSGIAQALANGLQLAGQTAVIARQKNFISARFRFNLYFSFA